MLLTQNRLLKLPAQNMFKLFWFMTPSWFSSHSFNFSDFCSDYNTANFMPIIGFAQS